MFPITHIFYIIDSSSLAPAARSLLVLFAYPLFWLVANAALWPGLLPAANS